MYSAYLTETLKLRRANGFTVLDLFAGAGGLSLGFEAAGFTTLGQEINSDACLTYNHNLKGKCVQERISVSNSFPKADVIIGGPPCQPFSVLGNRLGIEDDRNGFPAVIQAIKQVKPRIFLLENVKGLVGSHSTYFQTVLRSLRNLKYNVAFQVINAKDYGVPQNRERVLIIGSKIPYAFPKKRTLSVNAGYAINDILPKMNRGAKLLTKKMDQYIARYEKASKCVTPRDLNLSRPARTLTCRNLSGFTGDMHRIKMKNGRRRRLSIREAARLQSFPDWFEFFGTEASQLVQIGNAVPPLLAYQLAESFKKALRGNVI